MAHQWFLDPPPLVSTMPRWTANGCQHLAARSGPITTPGYEHFTLTMQIERVEPERVFAYRWHPYAIEPGVDYSKEPTTLVEFRLDDAAEGTRLTVVESGFDQLPAARRDLAFRMNEGGWAAQIKNIDRHVTGNAAVSN